MSIEDIEIEFFDYSKNILEIEKKTNHKIIYCNTFADFKKYVDKVGSCKLISTSNSYDDLFLRLTSAKKSKIGNSKLYDRENIDDDLVPARSILEFDQVTGRQKKCFFTKIDLYSCYADGELLHSFIKTKALRFNDIDDSYILNDYNIFEYYIIFIYEGEHFIYTCGQY